MQKPKLTGIAEFLTAVPHHNPHSLGGFVLQIHPGTFYKRSNPSLRTCPTTVGGEVEPLPGDGGSSWATLRRSCLPPCPTVEESSLAEQIWVYSFNN